VPATSAAMISAPLTGWRRMFADWLTVGSATAVCHLLGAAASLLLRVFISPAYMGIFSALKLMLSYGNYANLGISKGAAREFNVATGAGDTREARHGLNLAFTVNTLTSLLYALVLVGAGAWVALAGGGAMAGSWSLGLIAVAALAVLGRYVSFHVTILRAKQAFAVTSRLSIIEGLMTLTVCCTAAWRFGLPGLLAGTLIVTLGSLIFLQRHAAAKLRWAWHTAEIRRLIGIGGPILMAGAVSTLFRSLDKLMILGFFSDREHQLGCYSLSLLVSGQLFGLGNMLAMVIGPRLGEKFGNSANHRAVARLAARCGELQAAAIALPAAVALLIGAPLLERLLPDYRSGLVSLVWLVPGAVALTLALPGSQMLVAVGRQRRALGAVLVATVAAACGNYAALRGGYGLIGVAAATAAGYALYFVLVVAVSFWIDLDVTERLRYIVAVAFALGPTIGSALLLRHLWPDTVLASIGVVALVWGLIIAAGWQYGGWRQAFRSG